MHVTEPSAATPTELKATARAMRYLLFIAGMGGLLYGIDVGIIAGALPYLEATASVAWQLSAQQLSFIVAAVLLGSVLSSLFAGALADLIGRRWAMVLAGALFTLSIPLIALADGYLPLLLGRLLQGISGGLIGVVVPLYLAECLHARQRGRGAALFQLLLTIGLVAAALIGLYQAQSGSRQHGAGAGPEARADALFAARITHGAASSGLPDAGPDLHSGQPAAGRIAALAGPPRPLAQAQQALLRTRPAAEAQAELREIEQALAPESGQPPCQRTAAEPPLCAALPAGLPGAGLTQATGINSMLAYVVNILNQAGLPGASANMADVGLKVLNAVMTVVAVVLVDRKGRKFLLMLGTGGIVLALLAAGLLFRSAEAISAMSPVCCRRACRAIASIQLDSATLQALGASASAGATTGSSNAAADGPHAAPQQLTLAYSYGPFTNVQSRRSDDRPCPCCA
jgi:hypothetical protein